MLVGGERVNSYTPVFHFLQEMPQTEEFHVLGVPSIADMSDKSQESDHSSHSSVYNGRTLHNILGSHTFHPQVAPNKIHL